MFEKQCLICKINFKAKTERARYCSKGCQGKADYQKNKQAYKDREKKSRAKQCAKRRAANYHKWFGICEVCGINFRKKCQVQKYCSIKCQRNKLENKYKEDGRLEEWKRKVYDSRKEDKERYRKFVDKQTKYTTEKRREDPIWNLIHRLRVRTNSIFKAKDWKKENKTYELLGCTGHTLKNHLESQFVQGMTWENKGKWHLDHIIPLSSAKTEDELFKLCHYTNLQPLWGEDNLKKGNRMD
jgi:hypothetical protein